MNTPVAPLVPAQFNADIKIDIPADSSTFLENMMKNAETLGHGTVFLAGAAVGKEDCRYGGFPA
jgi:hypothetical protein